MNIARLYKPATPRRALWTRHGNIWKSPTSVNAARTETRFSYHKERDEKALTTKDTKIHEGLSARSQLLRVSSCPLWLKLSVVKLFTANFSDSSQSAIVAALAIWTMRASRSSCCRS